MYLYCLLYFPSCSQDSLPCQHTARSAQLFREDKWHKLFFTRPLWGIWLAPFSHFPVRRLKHMAMMWSPVHYSQNSNPELCLVLASLDYVVLIKKRSREPHYLHSLFIGKNQARIYTPYISVVKKIPTRKLLISPSQSDLFLQNRGPLILL